MAAGRFQDARAYLSADGAYEGRSRVTATAARRADDKALGPDSQRYRALSICLANNLSAAARDAPAHVSHMCRSESPLSSCSFTTIVRRSRRQGIAGCIILRAIVLIIKRIMHGRCLTRSFAIEDAHWFARCFGKHVHAVRAYSNIFARSSWPKLCTSWSE